MQGRDADEGGILPCIYHRPDRSFACGLLYLWGVYLWSDGLGSATATAGTTFHENSRVEIPAEYGLPLCGWAWRGVPGVALRVAALPAWVDAIGIGEEGA